MVVTSVAVEISVHIDTKYKNSLVCLRIKVRIEPAAIRTTDIVGTVYRLVIYMQSNKIHKVF